MPFRLITGTLKKIISVVVFGKMRIVENEDKKREICINLTRKFTDDNPYKKKNYDSRIK